MIMVIAMDLYISEFAGCTGFKNALFGLVPVQGHAYLGVARCTKSRPGFMRRCFVATAFPWETVP